MNKLESTLLAILAFVVVFLLVSPLFSIHLRVVPKCAEDVVLVGCGDFERGVWTRYECGPAVDDYIGGY